MRRFFPPRTGETHHVYDKSICRYVIFPTDREYLRMVGLIRYYLAPHHGPSYSQFINSWNYRTHGFEYAVGLLKPRDSGRWVELKAFCLMPTHVHFILRQTAENGIKFFMTRVLTSYSLFFNQLHNRNGPLWQNRYKTGLIRNDDHLAEKMDYVHNNPVKDLGLARPEDWPYSSYRVIRGLPTDLPNLLLPSPGV